ncbi:MAG: NAD(P)/FAD-dependent oxidoreductase [Lachnospiraceae bacterium]|nr:NAD(P)/FAD-dependent oxidoreductase [Lachnospiraceae bacterium Marseille-Q4251]
MYDVLIIGGGVTGSAIARELSRYDLKTALFEKGEDVCSGTSKANSGIAHAGFDAAPGSLKAKMNIRGSQMMEELSRKLDFPYKRNGSLVLCFDEKDRPRLEKLLQQGKENGVEGLEILEKKELLALEPALSEEVVCALHAPTGGIVCPFKLTIALAENAAVNGVEFHLNEGVKRVQPGTVEGYTVETGKGTYETRIVVNAAGLYGDEIHNQVSGEKLHITPRKGEYCLMDKKIGQLVSHTIFQMPTAMGKGVLVTPTVHGNLMVGPTATDISDKEGVDTTAEGLDEVLKKAALSVKSLPRGVTITSFAGLRAHEDHDDFILGEVKDAPGFFDAVGIESPGLTSAPAIGEWMAEKIVEKLRKTQKVDEKKDFQETRKDIPNIASMDQAEAAALIAENPAYGTIICRCEKVTEGEIIDAIRRPLGARSLDGIKRRTRAGMGRCQAGFCSTKVMDILARELGIPLEEVTKAGGASRMLTGGER